MLSESKDYDVSLDYDTNGYVNKFIIGDMEVSNKEIESNTSTDILIPNVDNIIDGDFSAIKEQLEEELNSMKSIF